MKLTFAEPIPSAGETDMLVQALLEVDLLRDALINLVGQDALLDGAAPSRALHFDLDYDSDKHLVSISVGVDPAKLDS